MPIIEGILGSLIAAIIAQSAKKAKKAASRSDRVLAVLKKAGVAPKLDRNSRFEVVYAHTLAEFGLGRKKEILDFFRHEDIQKACQDSFEKSDKAILHLEAENLLQWHKIGDEMRKKKLDPRLEFARFTAIFNTLVDRSRSPYEARLEGKSDEILRYLKFPEIDELRAEILRQIRGNLADQIKGWFKSLGYESGSHDIETVEYWEWIIKIPARRGFDTILVRATEEQGECDNLESLKSAQAEHKADEGWLICSHRVSQDACEMAEKDGKLFCYTFDELLDQDADFSNYFKWLGKQIEDKEIEKYYIPLACRREIVDPINKEKTREDRYDERNGWTEGYIERWLKAPTKEHISVLGEFGTGKTWFSLKFAYDQMKEYKKAKEKRLPRPRVPIVVQLRDFAKMLEVKSLFSDFFFIKHEILLPGYSSFEHLSRMGKLLLIFDGFDEMADKVDRQKMINNFWELAKVVVPGAKILLTCRTEHFPEAKEGRALLSAELKASTSHLRREPPQFEILHLEMFDDKQIRQALSMRTDENTIDLIMQHKDLLDVARRPVMMEFILDALPEIEAGDRLDLSRIYLYAVRRKMNRDIDAKRTFTSLADKLFFMCELSWEMLAQDKMSMNYRLFPERLKNLFGDVVAEEKDLDHWHHDMMGQSLLIRNEDGDYAPAHRSLLEFFAAIKACACLAVLPSDFLDLCRSREDVVKSHPAEDYTWSDYFRRKSSGDSAPRKIAPLKYFIAESVDEVLETLGGISENTLRLIHEITNVDEVRQKFHQIFQDLLDQYKDGRWDADAGQDVLKLIYRIRSIYQQNVEEKENDAPCGEWKEYHQREIRAAEGKAKIEIVEVSFLGGAKDQLEMVLLPAGAFLMGDEDYGPIRRVEIKKPFCMSKYQVTNRLYLRFVEATNGDYPEWMDPGSKYNIATGSDDHYKRIGDSLSAPGNPVVGISWLNTVRFLNWLSVQSGLPPAYRLKGNEVTRVNGAGGYRLPTETEWEYACRAGTTAAQYGDLDSVAWYSGNSDQKTHSVGQKEQNSFGLHDMLGNVWEWCWDWHDENKTYRVVRGGSWGDDPGNVRASDRFRNVPDYRTLDFGFRLSRD